MPTYKAPVDDVLFLLNDVFHIERYANLPGFADASPDVVEAILGEAAKLSEEVLTPLNRVGDKEGCKRARRRQRDHADRLQGRLQADRRRRLDRHFGAGRVRRPGPAGDHDADRQRVPVLGQHGLRDVSGPDAGRDRGAARARLGGAEGSLSAEDDRRRMDRHDEPDRAALRHRSRPAAHQGGRSRPTAATRSPAPRFSSRPASTIWPTTSSISCWRASKARPKAPGISLFVVPKVLPKRRRLARRAQRA